MAKRKPDSFDKSRTIEGQAAKVFFDVAYDEHKRLQEIAKIIRHTRKHGNFWTEDRIDQIYKLATSPLT